MHVAKVRLRWKRLILTNTLAYSAKDYIAVIKVL